MSVPDGAPSGSSGAVPGWASSAAPGSTAGTPAPGGFAPGVFAPGVPGAGHRRTGVSGSARWDAHGSPFRKSSTSFGIVGRTVITVLLLAVLVMIAFGNLFGVPVYLIFLVWALRDVWTPSRRPAPVPSRRPTPTSRTITQDGAWARPVYDDVPRSAPQQTYLPPSVP